MTADRPPNDSNAHKLPIGGATDRKLMPDNGPVVSVVLCDKSVCFRKGNGNKRQHGVTSPNFSFHAQLRPKPFMLLR